MGSQNGWIVGDTGTVLLTTNGGISWRSINTGTQADLTSVFFINAQQGWIAGTECVLRTTDGGLNWSKTTFNFLEWFSLYSFY